MKKLLVIVDVQNDFVDGALGTKEAQEMIPRLVEKIKNWDGDFLMTMDTHFADTYKYRREGRYLPVLHCVKFTDGWELNEEVDKAVMDVVNSHDDREYYFVEKTDFGTDQISTIIDDHGYDCVEFVGLCTDICVVTNALIVRTFCPEIEIAVDASCCAGVTPEKHNAALDVMESCHIWILKR